MLIKFNNHDEVINTLNAAQLFLGIMEDEEHKFGVEMLKFDDSSHIRIQLDYYCERWFKSMLYNIRLVQCIKWYLDNSKSLEELNAIINDALCGKTSYLVLIKPVEEDEIPF